MAFDPEIPKANTRVRSVELRNQFLALKALYDQLAAQVAALGTMFPVGCIAGYLKSLPQMPALPGTWVECDGQVINDAASPLNGVVTPDINGAAGPQRFLRGASTSGGTGGADMLSIPSEVPVDNNGEASTTTVVSGPQADLPMLPSYYEVVWVMRVK